MASTARVTQEFVEVLTSNAGRARVTQEFVQVLSANAGNVRVTQEFIEVLTAADTKARVTHEFVEVLTNVGSAIFERDLSDTVTLTDSAGATAGDLNDTLSLSDSFTSDVVYDRSLSDTLTLTELVTSVQIGEFEDELVLDDEAVGEAWKIGTFSDTLVLTEDLTYNLVTGRIIGDLLTFAETWAKNISQLLSFSDTVTFSETLDGVAVKVLGDSFTFSDVLTGFIAKLIHDEMEFGDTMVPNLVANRSMTDQLIPYETISIQLFSNLSFADTLIFTDSMVGQAIRPLSPDVITLSETITGVASKKLADSLLLDESLTFNRSINKPISDILSFSDDLDANIVIAKQLVETLNFIENWIAIRARFGTMSDTLTFDDQILREVHTSIIDNNLVLIDTVDVEKVGQRTFDETLSLTEEINVSQVLVRSITDYLICTDGFVVRLFRAPTSPPLPGGGGVSPTPPPTVPPPPGVPPPPPVPEGVIDVVPEVTFVGKTLSIVLPPPEWNDFIAGQGKIAVQRSMTGKFRVYAKRTKREKLNWRFVIPKFKADELRAFLLAEIDNEWLVTDWEGNVWNLKMLNDSVDFVESGRWGNLGPGDEGNPLAVECGNKFEVTLELVGTKYA